MTDALDDAILADSPILYWPLDDSSRGSAADTSGNGRVGAYNGLPLLRQPGLPLGGHSVRFGDSSFVDIVGSAALCPPSITCELFTWWNKAGGSTLAASYAAIPASWELGMDNSGTFYFRTDNGGADQRATDFRGGGDYPGQTFIHVVGSCDATHINLFVNGWQVAATNIAARSNSRTDHVRVGARAFAGAENYANGFTTRFALYNTVLSAGRVLAHFEASGLDRSLTLTQLVSSSGATAPDDLTAILNAVRRTI